MQAPPIEAKPLDASKPFPGWQALRGNFVAVDFWATWCGPCIPGLDKFAGLEKEFATEPVRFLTVASDEMYRVKKYFADKGLVVQTFVESDNATSHAFGVHGIPAAAIIDREGRIVGVTEGENVTAVLGSC
jgi:thiol-disulfide isomerase/thioredoxin